MGQSGARENILGREKPDLALEELRYQAGSLDRYSGSEVKGNIEIRPKVGCWAWSRT